MRVEMLGKHQHGIIEIFRFSTANQAPENIIARIHWDTHF